MLTIEQQAWVDDYIKEEIRMGTVARASSGEGFEIPDAGAVVGRCYMVADLGTQDTTFKGTPKKAHKVLLAWELAEKMSDGRPFAISSRYTLSLFDQAILRQHLESWRGRSFTEAELEGFDVKNVLGAYCLLSIVHNKDGDKTYANVKGIMPVPKGMEKPAPVNKDVYFDVDTGDLNTIPEWVQNVVKKSDEYKARMGGNGSKPAGKFDDMEDDRPWDANDEAAAASREAKGQDVPF
jgi:hypothetical protein